MSKKSYFNLLFAGAIAFCHPFRDVGTEGHELGNMFIMIGLTETRGLSAHDESMLRAVFLGGRKR
jgi:hypothetical protein